MSREHRIEMQKLADIAKEIHATERRITLDSVYMVESLELHKVWLHMRMKPAGLAVYIGLTPNMYWSRLRAARVLRDYPSLLKLYEAGETEISHIAMLYRKITAANETVIVEGIKGKPIPAAIRHKVWLRDQGQCTFVNADGSKCGQSMWIEIDHIDMVCRGGKNEESNLRLRCRVHNAWQAEQELGTDFMKAKILERKLAGELTYSTR